MNIIDVFKNVCSQIIKILYAFELADNQSSDAFLYKRYIFSLVPFQIPQY